MLAIVEGAQNMSNNTNTTSSAKRSSFVRRTTVAACLAIAALAGAATVSSPRVRRTVGQRLDSCQCGLRLWIADRDSHTECVRNGYGSVYAFAQVHD